MAADVVRPGAAAEAEVPDAELARGGAELGDLEAVAGERVERDRERPPRGTSHSASRERLEARLLLVRAVGHRQGGDVAVDRLTDRAEQRQHRPRPADAVEADDVGARVGQPLARLGRRPPVARRRVLVDDQRDHRRQPVARIASSAISASSPHEKVSPIMKSTPASTAQATCSSNIARTAA